MNLQNVKKLVESALKNNEQTRNDDKLLVFIILHKIKYSNYGFCFNQLTVQLEDLPKFPSFESIIRARAYIQNIEGRFPPTDETIRRRRDRQKEFRKLVKGQLC